MKSFTKKEITTPLTLGEKLQVRRIELGYDINTVSKRLNIQKKYISAIEKSDFKNFPSDIYVDNFVKSYIKFLDLNLKYYYNLYLKEKKLFNNIFQQNEEEAKKMRIFPKWFKISPRFFKIILVLLIVLGFVFYMYTETRKIFTKPVLHIYQPINNLVINEYIVDIVGQTHAEADLTINGRRIIVNREGYFQETISLQKGINIIKIMSKKKYSQPNIQFRQVMVND